MVEIRISETDFFLLCVSLLNDVVIKILSRILFLAFYDFCSLFLHFIFGLNMNRKILKGVILFYKRENTSTFAQNIRFFSN